MERLSGRLLLFKLLKILIKYHQVLVTRDDNNLVTKDYSINFKSLRSNLRSLWCHSWYAQEYAYILNIANWTLKCVIGFEISLQWNVLYFSCQKYKKSLIFIENSWHCVPLTPYKSFNIGKLKLSVDKMDYTNNSLKSLKKCFLYIVFTLVHKIVQAYFRLRTLL